MITWNIENVMTDHVIQGQQAILFLVYCGIYFKCVDIWLSLSTVTFYSLRNPHRSALCISTGLCGLSLWAADVSVGVGVCLIFFFRCYNWSLITVQMIPKCVLWLSYCSELNMFDIYISWSNCIWRKKKNKTEMTNEGSWQREVISSRTARKKK